MLVTTRRRTDCAGVAGEHTLGRQPLHLYGYLWTKPEFIVDDRSGCFSFVVPDTVLFKQQKPVKWFFTSRQEKGKILTKSKKNLSVTQVLQAFTEPRRSATSPRSRKQEPTREDEEEIVATYVYPDRAANGEQVMVVEHLTAAGVQQLLLQHDKPPISVLQRFVPTRSGYNHLIQSVFTPDSCLLRKCVNSNLVSDTRLCIPERTATFEADERLVKPRDMTSRDIREQIELMHLEMSNHLKKLIGKPIARNVTYFKHGADDRIYLLWSTMLSFETGSLAFAKNLRLSLSHQARLQHLVATTSSNSSSMNITRSAAMSTSSSNSQARKCPACRSVIPASLVDFIVTYKAIINAFDTGIPPLLECVLRPTSDERFKELCSDKEFLYRTIALCQACAKQINSAKKVKDRSAGRVVSPSNRITGKSDRDKPIYMQSAHSIFWGKVEREEASRLASAQAQNSRPRPKTAVTTRLSGRIRKQTLPNGLTRASLKRLLPDIAARSDNVSLKQSQNCMQRFAEYLRRTYGRPSARFALSRLNVYPPTPQVTMEMLQPIAEPTLLTEVLSYWHEFTKTHGTGSAIDLDVFDALLTVCPDVNSDIARCEHALPSKPQSSTQMCAASPAPNSYPALNFQPTPPVNRRPTSCRGIRSAPNRASRLSIRSMSTADVCVKDDQHYKQKSGQAFQNPLPAICESTIASSSTPTKIFTRVIDGSVYEVHVSALEENNAPTIVLRIRAIRANAPNTTSTKVHELQDNALELTLRTDEILQIFARDAIQAAPASSAPRTADELVEGVLGELVIQEGHLALRAHEKERHPESTAALSTTPPPVAITDASLTPEELHFLQETLLRDD